MKNEGETLHIDSSCCCCFCRWTQYLINSNSLATHKSQPQQVSRSARPRSRFSASLVCFFPSLLTYTRLLGLPLPQQQCFTRRSWLPTALYPNNDRTNHVILHNHPSFLPSSFFSFPYYFYFSPVFYLRFTVTTMTQGVRCLSLEIFESTKRKHEKKEERNLTKNCAKKRKKYVGDVNQDCMCFLSD